MLPVIGDVPESAVFSAGFPSAEELFPLAGAFPLESTDEVLPSVSGGGVFSCTFLGRESHAFALSNLARRAPHPSLPYIPAIATV